LPFWKTIRFFFRPVRHKKTVLVQIAQVTSHKPAVLHNLPRPLRVLIVPKHDGRPLDPNLFIDELHFKTAQHMPDGTVLIIAVVVGGNERGTLRDPISLEDQKAKLLQILRYFFTQVRARR
jgi:hypothetical protein